MVEHRSSRNRANSGNLVHGFPVVWSKASENRACAAFRCPKNRRFAPLYIRPRFPFHHLCCRLTGLRANMNRSFVGPSLSSFARGLTAETAFDVLAVARRLKSAGKDVIELQIGDSPYPSAASAIRAGKEAIDAGQTHYCPSLGLPEFRAAIARTVRSEFGIPATVENVVVAPGAK